MEKSMLAAKFISEGVLELVEIPVPKITRNEDVLVRVEMCSICGTDVSIMATPPAYVATPGTTLGHELVGKIVDVGPAVQDLRVGQRIVVNPNEYCGKCSYCRINHPNFCENIKAMGIDVDGGFAEYVLVDEKMAHVINEDVDVAECAFAEPLACLINGLEKIKILPGSSALVIGGGPIGLMLIKILKQAGVDPVIVSAHSDLRREYAIKSGADYVIDPKVEDLPSRIESILPIGPDLVVDMTGTQISEAVQLVRKGGTILLFGVNEGALPEVKQKDITTKEIDVVGTWLANASFPSAVKLLESGKLNFKDLVTHILPLEKLEEGIELLSKGDGVKVMIDLQEV